MKINKIRAILWNNGVCSNDVAIRDSICEVYVSNENGLYSRELTEIRARQIMNLGFKLYAERDGMIILANFGN